MGQNTDLLEELDISDDDNQTPPPADRGDELPPEDGPESEMTEDQAIDPELLQAVAGEVDPKTVPYGRFKEVNDKLRELEAMVTELKTGRKTEEYATQAELPEEFDIDAAEADYLQAFEEGDTQRALLIRKAINDEIRRQATGATQAELNRRTETELVNEVARQAVEKYPFLDDDGDPQAVSEVIEWRDFYAAKGDSPSQALAKAIGKVAPLYVKPSKEPTPAPPTVDKEKASQMLSAARERNAAASLSQAPQGGGVGERGRVELKPSEMTEEELSRLPDKEKRRLRGDLV